MKRLSSRFIVVFLALPGCTTTLVLGSDRAESRDDDSDPTTESSGSEATLGGGLVPDACVLGDDAPTCLACASRDCCDELQFCDEQGTCDCLLLCLREGGGAGECQGSCEASSGIAAVMACLGMQCGAACASASPSDT